MTHEPNECVVQGIGAVYPFEKYEPSLTMNECSKLSLPEGRVQSE